MTHRILLIEDDRALGAQIVLTLSREGFQVAWWTEGKIPDPASLDLLIVDLMLPGLYGLDILKALRAHSEVPVLVLSARADTSDKVRALQLGADDYMTKPFWPGELVERVRARLRRPVLVRDNVIEAGEVRIDLGDHRVLRAGQPVDLSRTEVVLLIALARRRGAAVTRAALSAAVQEAPQEGAERNLDVYISRLRKKLGDASLIETVWGVGYRLVAKVEP